VLPGLQSRPARFRATAQLVVAGFREDFLDRPRAFDSDVPAEAELIDPRASRTLAAAAHRRNRVRNAAFWSISSRRVRSSPLAW
jgi:hypothetical protein